jgi:glucose-6-phosphate dehydrogenase assembly protein OpcA
VKSGATRVFTATVIAIVTPETSGGIVAALSALSRAGVRPVLISLGDSPEPVRRDEDTAIVIEGLLPKYLDNAVAYLRLSSLPTLGWWRAEDPEILKGLAAQVDRVVLDADDPSDLWPLVPDIAALAPVSDMRWTRLTRWRELLAQFFDVPEVRAAADSFDELRIAGSDPHATRLLAGCLRSRLPAGERLSVHIDTHESSPIGSVRLSGRRGSLAARVMSNGTCVETTVEVAETQTSRRVVPAADRRPEALVAEELRVRSRDRAFEDAVRSAQQL